MAFKLLSAQRAQIKNGWRFGVLRVVGIFILLVSYGCFTAMIDAKFPLLPWALISTLGFCCLFCRYSVVLDSSQQSVIISASNLWPVKRQQIAFQDITGIVVDEVLLERRKHRLLLQLTNGQRFALINHGYRHSLEQLAEKVGEFIHKPVHKTYE